VTAGTLLEEETRLGSADLAVDDDAVVRKGASVPAALSLLFEWLKVRDRLGAGTASSEGSGPGPLFAVLDKAGNFADGFFVEGHGHSFIRFGYPLYPPTRGVRLNQRPL
jgi:hypothetical protein